MRLHGALILEVDALSGSRGKPLTHLRVIVFHGKGRFFSAGADIKEFTAVKSGVEFSELASKWTASFLNDLSNFSKSVIAAIHGAALGGGLGTGDGLPYPLL